MTARAVYQGRRGITRVELLILLLILVLGLGFLAPWIVQSRSRSRLRVCEQRQVAIYFAFRRQHALTGQLPSYRVNCAGPEEEPFYASWVFPLLPFLALPYTARDTGYDPLDDDRRGPWAELQERFGPQATGIDREEIRRQYIPQLTCANDPPPDLESGPKRSWLSFVVNTGLPDRRLGQRQGPQLPADWPANGVLLDELDPASRQLPPVTLAAIDAADGLDHTLLLSENMDSGDWTDDAEQRVGFIWVARHNDAAADWGKPLLRFDQQVGDRQGQGVRAYARPSSRHPGGVIAVHASGRSTLLDPNIDYRVYCYLMTSDDSQLQQPGSLDPLPDRSSVSGDQP